jgi:hypothetical protein
MSTGENSRGSAWRSILAPLGGIFAILALLGLAILALDKVNALRAETILPILLIVGVVALLGVLSTMATSFALAGLKSANSPLGLPDGTVSAVIALMLILIFSITSLYLYANIAFFEEDLHRSSKISAAEVARIPPQDIVSINPNVEDSTKFDVLRRISHPGSDDFARQILSIVGTLLVAVVAFYFGARFSGTAPAGTAPPGTVPAVIVPGGTAPPGTVPAVIVPGGMTPIAPPPGGPPPGGPPPGGPPPGAPPPSEQPR